MQQGSSSTATLTDEQILGLEPMPENGTRVVAQGADALCASGPEAFLDDATPDAHGTPLARGGDAAQNPQGPGHNAAGRPELQPAAAAANAAAGAANSDPAWLAALEAQPNGREAAAEARAWRSAATDIAGLDAAYFSADPSARSGLAARLYDTDPAAFRAMLAESARVIAQRDPAALAELAQQLSARSVAQGAPANFARGPEAFVNDPPRTMMNATEAQRQNGTENPQGPGFAGHPELQPAAAQQHAAFPAEAYRSFEASTNDAIARRVQQQIDRTLGSTLPEGTPEGARRRIAEDIFEEVHASLSADRDLARRVGETLRDWRFDGAARAQVTDLLSGRARAVLPEVARRVVAEWTSSVLATDRAKSARIASAVARRDVTGGRLPEPVPASALRPRDVDYRRLSDEQILDL